MASLTPFGLGILALLAVWKFMLRPAIQDSFKDLLFDVRDNLRQHFAARGQLDTVAYQELRDTLNGYIRFVEVANLARTFRFAVQLDQNPKVAERFQLELDRRFEVKDVELAKIAKASRKRCSRIIQMYVFHSSFLSVATIYIVFVPMAIAWEACKLCRERALHSWKALWVGAVRFVQAREDGTIEPRHTELFSQRESLQFA